MQRISRLFGKFPVWFSCLMGGLLCAMICLQVVGQGHFQSLYQNLSLLSNPVLYPFALAFLAGLMILANRTQASPKAEGRRQRWFLQLLFLVVLGVQFIIARSCWYKMGWDVASVYTTAEELARGIALSEPEYFLLCPNNAPLTILHMIPLWVAVKLGLAVPFVVLPYIDAVLLNLSAYFCVRCVQLLTSNRVARLFALVVSIGWIALSPYILYPYTDTFGILFTVLPLYLWLRIKQPLLKWFLISLLCSFGASLKPSVWIVLIALVILGVCRFIAQENKDIAVWKQALVLACVFVLGILPGRIFQNESTRFLTGTSTPQEQLSTMHYLMLGMNGETYGGHSVGDVEFSQSFETLQERQHANLQRAWERLSSRNLLENLHFFAGKAFKAYADGSFASHSSFLELEIPKRTDGLSTFLRSLYHKRGALMPLCQTLAQGLWLGVLTLCAYAAIRMRKNPAVQVLALTLLGLTAYLLLLEVWPRYLFLYSPFYVILASMALEKPLSFKR